MTTATKAMHTARERNIRLDTASFHQQVYALVERVPAGRVTTYGDIALALGWPRHARMVGQAMAHCTADLPAHRVVTHSGAVARACKGMPIEGHVARLRAEGVTFTKEGHVDLRRHIQDLYDLLEG